MITIIHSSHYRAVGFQELTPVQSPATHCGQLSVLHFWPINLRSSRQYSTDTFRPYEIHWAFRNCSPPPHGRLHWNFQNKYRVRIYIIITENLLRARVHLCVVAIPSCFHFFAFFTPVLMAYCHCPTTNTHYLTACSSTEETQGSSTPGKPSPASPPTIFLSQAWQPTTSSLSRSNPFL